MYVSLAPSLENMEKIADPEDSDDTILFSQGLNTIPVEVNTFEQLHEILTYELTDYEIQDNEIMKAYNEWLENKK